MLKDRQGTTRSGWRRTLKRLVGLGATLSLAATAVALVQPLWAFDVLARVFPRVLWRVSTTQPLVALSFDDGPVPDHTQAVLAALARHEAHATFFLVGDRALAYPELVAELRASGHETGNHSFTLRSTLRMSDADFVANLTRTEQALSLAAGPKLFRPPGGLIRPAHVALAQARGYRVVLGSAYPFDPAHPPPRYIQWLVTKNLAAGVIIILHDGIADPAHMLAVLDAILAEGRRRGLRFVSIGELLRAQAGEHVVGRDCHDPRGFQTATNIEVSEVIRCP